MRPLVLCYHAVSSGWPHLLAVPPEQGYEQWVQAKGRWFALAGPVMRFLAERRRRGKADPAATAEALGAGAYGPVLAPLAGLPGTGRLVEHQRRQGGTNSRGGRG